MAFEEIKNQENNEKRSSFVEVDIPRTTIVMEGAEEIPGYLEQITNSYAIRQKEVQQSIKDWKAGEMDSNTGIEWLDSLVGDAQFKIQGIGKGVAGPVLDTAGVAVGAAIDGISFMIPDAVEDPIKQQLAYAWDWTMNTEAGQEAKEAFNKGTEAYNKWKEENPQYAKTFESLVNVGLVIAPTKGVKPGSKPKNIFAGPVEGPQLNPKQNTLQKIASSSVKAGATQAKNERFEDIRALLAPAITKENITQRTPDGEAALIPATTFRDATLKPSSSDIPVIEHIASLKNINPKKGATDAIVKVNNLNNKLDGEIAKILSRKDIAGKRVNIASLNGRVNYALNQAIQTPAMQSIKELDNMVKGYKRLLDGYIKKNGNSPAGIHQSRIDFDNYMKSEVGGQAFDVTNPGVRTAIVKAVRDQLNRSVDELVPLNSVSKRRSVQNLNYRALDKLAPKGFKEIDKAIIQTSQNILKTTRNARTVAGVTTTLGAGYLGYQTLGKDMLTALALAGGVTIAGIGSRHLIKGAMSAKAKNNFGRFISQIDRALAKTKNPDMRLSLKRNKAYIVSLMNMPTDNSEEE
jgi:hypothetical protein